MMLPIILAVFGIGIILATWFAATNRNRILDFGDEQIMMIKAPTLIKIKNMGLYTFWKYWIRFVIYVKTHA